MADTFQELPGAWKLLRIWGKIGLQSFGGGATTALLIQRAFIDENKWMTMEDFTRYWSLCVFTPGINLVALTILIGRRFGGTPGIVASLVGMLLPSAFITCLLTAGFQLIQSNHNVQAMLKGIIPATAGIMLLVGINFAYPQIKQAYKEGLFSLSTSIILMLASAAAVIVFKLSVIPVLLVTALLGMLLFTSWRVKTVVQQGIEQEEKEPIHD